MHEGHRERMRKRLSEHGASLTDHELLEILLFEVIGRKDTNPVAHRLLDSFCDLHGVFSATPRLLCTVAGIGPRAAEHVYLVGCLMRAMDRERPVRPRLYSYGEAGDFAAKRFSGESTEKLEFYFTDEDGYLICLKSVGGEGSSVAVSERELTYILGEVKPTGVVLAHNHPSGTARPSAEDDGAVEHIGAVCRRCGASLNDSLIFAGGEIFSYYGAGKLPKFR